MADLFELRMEEDRLAMLGAMEDGDLGGVGACAHRLKGSSGSLGLLGIRACAVGIEEAAKAGRQAACRSALEGLPAVGEATLRAFRGHLGPSA
jgi:HPt (histidine-containing phosphotransfer) domain-containing protein